MLQVPYDFDNFYICHFNSLLYQSIHVFYQHMKVYPPLIHPLSIYFHKQCRANNAWALWAVARGPHANLCMLCTACYLMFKH
jgi:hypothetical protein